MLTKLTDILMFMRVKLVESYINYDRKDYAECLIMKTIGDLDMYKIEGSEHFTGNVRDLFSTLFLMSCINEVDEMRVILKKIKTELTMQDNITKKYFLENEVGDLPYDIRQYIVDFI